MSPRLKQQLRMLSNTILDVRLQTMGMTDREALDLMVKQCFQETEEATGKLGTCVVVETPSANCRKRCAAGCSDARRHGSTPSTTSAWASIAARTLARIAVAVWIAPLACPVVPEV